MQHVHISGIQTAITVLSVIAVLGTLNLLAIRFSDSSSFWKSYANLFGLN